MSFLSLLHYPTLQIHHTQKSAIPHQPFQNRTIPRPAPTPLPPLLKVRCCRPKKFGRLPEGLPHHHPSLAPTLPNPHYPLLCTITLASLVKGEVLSPEKIRATTGGIAFLPHPSRFSDTSVNNPSIVGSASHCNRSSPLHKGAKGDSALPTLPNPHYPTLSTTFLAPLPKGAGLRQGYFLL